MALVVSRLIETVRCTCGYTFITNQWITLIGGGWLIAILLSRGCLPSLSEGRSAASGKAHTLTFVWSVVVTL
jgi:hypothetical protein